ncbi:hypothetical protein [Kitasatospora sp. NBC_01539]|uniref:hypothetical protein n=1 Tax=Kitasatospora sp. NBC_01539 TaxID=2903577 RepID=UPI0038602095
MPHPDPAADWLAAAATDPQTCHAAWARGAPALLPTGRLWDVLLVPAALGSPALALLATGPDPGPVLVRPEDGRLGFLVPPGTSAGWTATGIHAAGDGTLVPVPPPTGPGSRGPGVHWLVPPDGSGRLVDPARLELALHEAAATLGGTP